MQPLSFDKIIAVAQLHPQRQNVVGVQNHAPGALPPRETQQPLYRRVGGPPGPSRWVRKISPPLGFDPFLLAIPINHSGRHISDVQCNICFKEHLPEDDDNR
jgi:hypothetical protein